MCTNIEVIIGRNGINNSGRSLVELFTIITIYGMKHCMNQLDKLTGFVYFCGLKRQWIPK